METRTLSQLLQDEDPFTGASEDGFLTYYPNLVQGSDEWLKARIGLLTASEMKLAVTPSLSVANNDKIRSHVFELAAQRLTKYVEPHYVNDDMLRGHEDEIDALQVYHDKIGPVRPMGFITNSRHGFTLGYSPDGLVNDDGLVEIKSRRQKHQVKTIVAHLKDMTIPADFLMQIQTGLLVAERDWLDFVSYSGGLPMISIRTYPDDKVMAAILEASETFEERIQETLATYQSHIELPGVVAIPTERKEREDLIA